MNSITANELKVKGVSVLEKALAEENETVISVRGKPRFVIMEIGRYEQLREAEIEAAWLQAREDLRCGDFVKETAEEHRARLEREPAQGDV
jgi:prevent-host-death family protein